MTRRRAALMASLMLTACGPQAEPAAPASPSAMVANRAEELRDVIASAERLAGEYRIAGVDREAIDLPYGITASISPTRIHVVADCVNVAWNYIFEGEVLVTERAPVEGCGRGLTRQEEAVVAAFDAATSVSVNRANGIDFTGDGHTVTLFSQ